MMKETIKMVLHIGALATVIIGVVLFSYIGYLMFYQFKPAEFLNSPFPVEKKQIKQGEVLRYYIMYNKYMNVPVHVQQTLINHVQINFPATNTNLPTGEYKTVNNDVTIPSYVTPGEAYLLITFTYEVNPLRTIVLTAQTERFKIIEK